jgi:hypothetical protein
LAEGSWVGGPSAGDITDVLLDNPRPTSPSSTQLNLAPSST